MINSFSSNVLIIEYVWENLEEKSSKILKENEINIFLNVAENSLKDENCETKQDLKLKRGKLLLLFTNVDFKVTHTSGDVKYRNLSSKAFSLVPPLKNMRREDNFILLFLKVFLDILFFKLSDS